MAPDFQTSVMG